MATEDHAPDPEGDVYLCVLKAKPSAVWDTRQDIERGVTNRDSVDVFDDFFDLETALFTKMNDWEQIEWGDDNDETEAELYDGSDVVDDSNGNSSRLTTPLQGLSPCSSKCPESSGTKVQVESTPSHQVCRFCRGADGPNSVGHIHIRVSSHHLMYV